jgi:large subunit ribosomal protein L14e
VLIDGPQKTTGIHRQVYLLKRLALTDIVVKIGKNSSQKKLEAAWTSEGVVGKWEATAWAKKLAAKKKRAALSDFDRFKVMVAKKQRAKATK